MTIDVPDTISSTTFCAASLLKSFTTTFAPREAKRSEYLRSEVSRGKYLQGYCTHALPRPPPAPVTTTVCPLNESCDMVVEVVVEVKVQEKSESKLSRACGVR